MRPNARVVAELRDLKDLVFRFHVAVFGDPDVNADAVFANFGPIQSAILNRFVRAISRDRTGSRSSANIFFLLILQRVKMSNTGQNFADIPRFKF